MQPVNFLRCKKFCAGIQAVSYASLFHQTAFEKLFSDYVFFFILISFSWRKIREEENKHAWLKNKNSFKRRWNIKRLYWNTSEWERWSKMKTTNSFKTFSFISFQWLFRFAHRNFFLLRLILWIKMQFFFSSWNSHFFGTRFQFNWWKVVLFFFGRVFWETSWQCKQSLFGKRQISAQISSGK